MTDPLGTGRRPIDRRRAVHARDADAASAGERLAAAAFERLALPDVRSASVLVDRVAAMRGRPITVTELPSLAGTRTCGWWNARERRDEILIAPPSSERHRDALVLHEVGHIVLDHFGLVSRPSWTQRTQNGQVDADQRPNAFRSHFEDADEIAAELLADAFARTIRRGPLGLRPFLRVFS
jgi:hypothetical protein